MTIKDFLAHLEDHNCTAIWGDKKYTATNKATGATSMFAKNGNKIADNTVHSVCTELGISAPF